MKKGKGTLDALLEYAVDRNASDIHLRVGRPPKIRLAGSLIDATKEPLSSREVDTYLFGILTEEQKEEFQLRLICMMKNYHRRLVDFLNLELLTCI